MNTQHQREGLRWKHKPVPELVRLAWPIAVSLLSYSAMTLVSTLFVGRLGASQLAGVGLGGIAAFGLVGFGFGLLRSVKVVVSQATGAGRRQEIPVQVAAGVVVALGLGVLAILLGRGLVAVVPRFSADVAAGDAAASYLALRNLGAPFVLIAVALRESRYGLGDSRSPLVAALAANLTNIALDSVLILGLSLGVKGAGAAAAISHVVEASLLLRASRETGIAWALLRPRYILDTLRLGVPLGVQFLLEIGAFSVLVVLLARISAVDLAAHQIALQVTHVSFLPALALGEAASVLAGQAVGAGEDWLVRVVARRALLIAAAYTGACAVAFVLLASLIAGGFSKEGPVQQLAARLLWVAAAFQVFDAANVVARSVLRGTGDVKYSAAIAVATTWVCLPPLGFVLASRLGLGAFGGWLALSAEIVIGALLLWHRLERGHWQRFAALSRERLAARGSLPEPEHEVAPASVA